MRKYLLPIAVLGSLLVVGLMPRTAEPVTGDSRPDFAAVSVDSELRRSPARVRDWPAVRAWMQGRPINRSPTMQPVYSRTALAGYGGKVFAMYCVNCHGKGGQGDGPRAPVFEPRPRDFTRGVFKFRSTASGEFPTREDLFRTITGGLQGTGMPAFADLPEVERWALVEYVRRLSPAFARAPEPEPVELPPAPTDLSERVARGERIFQSAQCVSCHGARGLGDGPSASTLTDADGAPVRTPNFATRPFKYGTDPEQLFRTLVTGLDGTPMPSYADSLRREEVWDVVAYVGTLVGDLASPAVTVRDVVEAREFVRSQRQQASHALVGGCGCAAGKP